VRLAIPLLLVVLVLAAPAGAAPIAPCTLVTRAEASAVLGFAVGPPRAEQIGFYRQCMYKHVNSFVAVQTRAISKAAFLASEQQSARPVATVRGLGVPAFSAAATVLYVWRNGTEASFLVFAPTKSIRDTEALAKKVLNRI
jgi:hypothetical protein